MACHMPEVLQQELGSISSFSAPAQATSRGIVLPTSVSCPAAGSWLCAWGGHISCVQCQQGRSLPQGLLETGFALLLLWKRLLEERHLSCLRVWQGAQGVLQSLSSLNVAPGCGACRGVQPFGLFQFECLGRILGSPEHSPVKTALLRHLTWTSKKKSFRLRTYSLLKSSTRVPYMKLGSKNFCRWLHKAVMWGSLG